MKSIFTNERKTSLIWYAMLESWYSIKHLITLSTWTCFNSIMLGDYGRMADSANSSTEEDFYCLVANYIQRLNL